MISIKISIEVIDQTEEEEIRIRCHQADEEIHELVNKIKTETLIILGYHEDRISRIKLSDIYYFEAVDGKVFAYGKNNVHEVKQKLYELEETLQRETLLSRLQIDHSKYSQNCQYSSDDQRPFSSIIG